MSLFWQSLFTWSNEAATFLLFGWGCLLFIWRLAGRQRTFPNVTDRTLRGFMLYQVFFIAAWSVLFKDLLPDSLRQTSGPLYHGWSQTFAVTAQDVGYVFCLGALWVIMRNVFERRREEVISKCSR